MCGIAGYFYFSQKKKNCDAIERMSRAIRHRGPDDEGFVFIDTEEKKFLDFSSGDSDKQVRERLPEMETGSFNFNHNLAMAHRRFSIIDLSSAGHQPMWNHDKSLCVVFNGEIFNYTEIRMELEAMGVVFRTDSDTEAILMAYSIWGKDAFKRFTGFWAFSLYDRRNNILIFSRDRIGKKPLYLYRDRNVLVWASEIKSILQVIDPGRLNLNDEACCNYLYYGKRDLGHGTFWSEIRMMDNASYMVVTPGGDTECGEYWKLPESRIKEEDLGIQAAQEKFKEVLTLSLSERLKADVPIAFELSGGMDSSSMVALRAGIDSSDFAAFTVKYSTKEEDESHFAEKLAGRFSNVEHHIINFEVQNLWEHMNEFVHLIEEPFHAPSLLVSHLLRSKIRDLGYRVLVSGSGGDEVLAGYTEYAVPIMKKLKSEKRYIEIAKNLLLYKEKYPLRFRPMFRIFMNRIFNFVPENLFYLKYLNMDMGRVSVLQKPENVDRLLIRNMCDLRMYYWMSSGDKSTMGIPLEARAPFLDHRVVDFAFSLPVSYLMRNGWLKWILRKSLHDILPSEVVWRKKKMGFPFPLAEWILENRSVVKGILKQYNNNWVNNRLVLEEFPVILKNDPNFFWRVINFQLWKTIVVDGEAVDYKRFG